MTIDMPKESKLKLPSIGFKKNTIGERIANFRKKLGWTQAELAEKMGSLRSLVSDYERGKLRVHGEMLARFSLAVNFRPDFTTCFRQKFTTPFRQHFTRSDVTSSL